MKEKLIVLWENISRLGTTFIGRCCLGVFLCSLILKFPILITAFFDENFSKEIFIQAENIRGLVWPLILGMLAKQFTETGGTKAITVEAVKRVEEDVPPTS